MMVLNGFLTDKMDAHRSRCFVLDRQKVFEIAYHSAINDVEEILKRSLNRIERAPDPGADDIELMADLIRVLRSDISLGLLGKPIKVSFRRRFVDALSGLVK